ncbi:MAG TPA: prepilin peptidase [Roseovarius sp.]|nr:prepilin peptidase [Roseovarius sp.]
MAVHITSAQALWFLPFVLPICLWVVWSDLRSMKIPNKAVLALLAVFAVIGFIALPLEDYPWRWLYFLIVLTIGIFANAAGLMGAGDSKFLAAAAPFIDPGDLALISMIFATNTVACYVTHRIVKHSPLRAMAPTWESWSSGNKFPMGFALGSSLVIYLGFGAVLGQ